MENFKKQFLIKNKKAAFQYEFIDSWEAGIQLKGTEIKSIRLGKVSIKEGYCAFKNGELFAFNVDIAPYKDASFVNHEPKRARKLLLHAKELQKLMNKKKDVGLTIVPTKLYINSKGIAKMTIVLAKGKKLQDKRESLKAKDHKRQMDRALKRS